MGPRRQPLLHALAHPYMALCILPNCDTSGPSEHELEFDIVGRSNVVWNRLVFCIPTEEIHWACYLLGRFQQSLSQVTYISRTRVDLSTRFRCVWYILSPERYLIIVHSPGRYVRIKSLPNFYCSGFIATVTGHDTFCVCDVEVILTFEFELLPEVSTFEASGRARHRRRVSDALSSLRLEIQLLHVLL